jgi:CheY-like chemotaxis protein
VVRTVSYDALLLDLHLLDGRGLDFLRKLRRRGDVLPVVILTARDLVSDRIEGLKAGADDYIVKPFDLDEVNARLEAVSCRYFGKAVPVVQVGPVELEWESKVARLDGRPVELSAREWAVIEVLGRRRQSTVSKEQIEDALYAFGGGNREQHHRSLCQPQSPQTRARFHPHDTRSRLSLGRLRRGRQESGFAVDLGRRNRHALRERARDTVSGPAPDWLSRDSAVPGICSACGC